MPLSPLHRMQRPWPAPPFYLVLADFGKLGQAYVERDPRDSDWVRTVDQIAKGEWRDVLQVIEVDIANGTSADVTERAMFVAGLVREGVPESLLANRR